MAARTMSGSFPMAKCTSTRLSTLSRTLLHTGEMIMSCSISPAADPWTEEICTLLIGMATGPATVSASKESFEDYQNQRGHFYESFGT